MAKGEQEKGSSTRNASKTSAPACTISDNIECECFHIYSHAVFEFQGKKVILPMILMNTNILWN